LSFHIEVLKSHYLINNANPFCTLWHRVKDMDESSGDSRPLKRVKLDDDQVSAVSQDGQDLVATQNGLGVARMADTLTVDDSAKELQVGITAFVDPVRGVFKGVLKKRYTDFLVNEILPDGRVLHLQSMDAGSSLASSASAQNGPNTGDANKETVTTEAATIGDETGEASGGQGKVRAEERAEDDAEANSKDVKSDVSLNIILLLGTQSLKPLGV
jgi:tRNA pseudouridine13 synthase